MAPVPNPEDRRPSSQDYPAKKMKLSKEEIPDSHETTAIKFEDCKDYSVLLNKNVIVQHRSSGEDFLSLFSKVMKDAGCCESKIFPGYSYYGFFARLTREEAQKLSGQQMLSELELTNYNIILSGRPKLLAPALLLGDPFSASEMSFL